MTILTTTKQTLFICLLFNIIIYVFKSWVVTNAHIHSVHVLWMINLNNRYVDMYR